MKTPRPCAEIVNGIVMDENGNNVHSEYVHAVEKALNQMKDEDIDLVILQSRSPTCGVNQVYDGSFRGTLTTGMGLFAKALKQKGYQIVDDGGHGGVRGLRLGDSCQNIFYETIFQAPDMKHDFFFLLCEFIHSRIY